MVNERQINNAALKNASEVIKLKKDEERYNIYIMHIKMRIESLLKKIKNVKTNIKIIKKARSKDIASYRNCEYEIGLARSYSMREAKKHISFITNNEKLNEEYLIDKHNEYFEAVCNLDDEVLSLKSCMNDISFDIQVKDTQISNLKILLKQYKHLLIVYKKYIDRLDNRIDFCKNKIKISTGNLCRFYLNDGNEECSKSKKVEIKSLKKA